MHMILYVAQELGCMVQYYMSEGVAQFGYELPGIVLTLMQMHHLLTTVLSNAETGNGLHLVKYNSNSTQKMFCRPACLSVLGLIWC